MKSRILILVGLAGVLLWIARQPEGVEITQAAGSGPAAVSITADGIDLTVRLSDYTLETVTLDGTEYDRILLPEATSTWRREGAVELPVLHYLIAVPPDAEVHLSWDVRKSDALDGTYSLAPSPSPLPLEEDLVPGEVHYMLDADFRAGSSLYPAEPAAIADEAWIRGQRVINLVVFPFQVIPSTGQLFFQSEVHFRIDYANAGAPAACEACTYDSELEATLARDLLNYDQGKTWRVPSGSEQLRSQIQSPETNPFLGSRFEIVVEQDGVYHLTYADLAAAGMDVDDVDPQTFRLVNHGEDAAIHVVGEGDGSFDPGDYIAFFGEKFHGDLMQARYEDTMTVPGSIRNDPLYAANNWFWQCESGCDLASYFERYTDANVYYLLEGGAPGPRMASVDGTPGGAPIPAAYPATARAEVQNLWWSWEWYDDDIWFWDRITQFTTKTYPITLTGVASGTYTATIQADIASRIFDLSFFPDHHSIFALNSMVFDDATWDGQKRYSAQAEIPQSILLEGANTLSITLVNDGAPFSGPNMYFDYVEIGYRRTFSAAADRLDFHYDQAGTWKYQVSGLASTTVEVYDVSDRFAPVRVINADVTGSPGNTTASFQVASGDSARYLVAGTEGAVLTPVKIAAYDPPDFSAMPPADYILITHSDFMTATQDLADFRTAQGYTVAVIDVEDLYHEFNDGIFHPIAIKNFLAYAFANWPEPPVYVTLVGSGNWNMKDFGDGTQSYHNPPPTYMPPNLAYVDPYQGEVDSPNLLATIIGDDVIADLYIGRIPAKTDAEMAAVVAKIIAYETAGFADWQTKVTFIADNIPDLAGNFIGLAESVITAYIDPNPLYQPIRIYEDDGDGVPDGGDYGCTTANTPNCDAVTNAIINTVNITGTLLVSYNGHGAMNRWSGESILLNPDIPLFNNPNQLPVVLSMTCLDGYWTYPNSDSLAYLFLTSAGKGAVATFSSTGLGIATGHDDLQTGFFASLLEDGDWRLGPATEAGKFKVWTTGFYMDLIHTYIVFGDPAMGIKTANGVNLTAGATALEGQPGEDVIYNLTVQNAGQTPDSFDISVTPGDWTAVPSVTSVGPLNPGQTAAIQVTVSIPANALGNDSDGTLVTAVSQSDVSKTDSIQLTTTALTDGLALTPPSQTLFGLADSMVTFQLTVTNTTTLADTFTVAVNGASWQVSAPASVGPVAGGAAAVFQVTVTIPQTALPGDEDTFSVQVTSQNDPGNSASSALTVIVSGAEIFLPIINRSP